MSTPMRKLSKGQLAKLKEEDGTRVLRKGKKVEVLVPQVVREVIPEATVLQLLNSHDELLSQVTDLKEAMATERVWKDMKFSVSRKRDGAADKLEVRSVTGATAMFHVERDGEGFISGLRTIRSDPGISLSLDVVRDGNHVLMEVVTVG